MKVVFALLLSGCLCFGDALGASLPKQTWIPTGDSELYSWNHEVFSGYIPVREETGSSLFYQLFAAYGSPAYGNLSFEAPLIIWFQGGPGCASTLGLFEEMGPYSIGGNISSKSFAVEKRYGSWNEHYHMLFIDQPIGAGFSPALGNDTVNSTNEAAKDIGTFFSSFYDLYSNYSLNTYPTFIAGESYAGHYLPAFLKQLIAYPDSNYPINLQGGALGDGLVDIYYQFNSYADYSFATGLLDFNQYMELSSMATEGEATIINGDMVAANEWGEVIIDYVVNNAGQVNILNYAQYTTYAESFEEEELGGSFLSYALNNWHDARDYMNIETDVVFEDCSGEVYEQFVEDIAVSFVEDVDFILDKDLSLLIYNGQNDITCNTLGTNTWMKTMKWNGLGEFQNQKMQRWNATDGSLAGLFRKYENLAFASVTNAGHMVPKDQLNNSRVLIDNLVNGVF